MTVVFMRTLFDSILSVPSPHSPPTYIKKPADEEALGVHNRVSDWLYANKTPP